MYFVSGYPVQLLIMLHTQMDVVFICIFRLAFFCIWMVYSLIWQFADWWILIWAEPFLKYLYVFMIMLKTFPSSVEFISFEEALVMVVEVVFTSDDTPNQGFDWFVLCCCWSVSTVNLQWVTWMSSLDHVLNFLKGFRRKLQ